MLSLFADDFSRTAELQDTKPGLSKWRIDQALQHAIEAGKGQPVPTILQSTTIKWTISLSSSLDSLRPEFTQDVAFGSKPLKLDTGEKIIIPAVIRTVIPYGIIQQYLEY